MQELLEGDILWGMFPMDSGNGKAFHPAIVIGNIAGRAIALLGTSENVPPRSGQDCLVLAPHGKPSMDHDWRLTGLARPTRFSVTAKSFPVTETTPCVRIGTIREFKPHSGCREWLDAARPVYRAAAARLISLIMGRTRLRT